MFYRFAMRFWKLQRSRNIDNVGVTEIPTLIVPNRETRFVQGQSASGLGHLSSAAIPLSVARDIPKNFPQPANQTHLDQLQKKNEKDALARVSAKQKRRPVFEICVGNRSPSPQT